MHVIFTVRPGGRDLRQVTSDDCSEIDLTPVWSPDGRWILYREGLTYGTNPAHLIRIRGDGSDRTDLGPKNTGYAWALDGERLAWDGIYIGPLDNPQERWLTAGREPAWSPNGRELVVVKNCEVEHSLDFCTRLVVVDAATGARLRVPIRNQVVQGPDWAPDGRRIVYLGTGTRTYNGRQPYQVWVMPGDGRKRRQLTRDKQGVTEVVWSPDGRWIAFTRVTKSTTEYLRDLWLMRPDGTDKHRIARNVVDMSWQRR
jgi:Tol biopolymer transport system component